MNQSCLIANTTREQREKIVADALAISMLDADKPTEDVMAMAQQYIDGTMELAEIESRVLQKYRK
ncbi:MAG: hypothetical protein IKI37_06870 [Oscillospiraceae bacterium]|nr:hypothetical protein [Oscillospiraceae bacterium]